MPDSKYCNRHIHLTLEEADRLRENAKKCGITQSQYIRNLINGHIPKESSSVDFYDMMKNFYDLLNRLEDSEIDDEIIMRIRDMLFEIEKKVYKSEKRTN